MILSGDRRFPPALAAAMAVGFDSDSERDGESDGDGDYGVDFEPFPDFLSADETTEWFRDWTGNDELTGDDFRVFGQDGTGGYAAFWLARPGRALDEQPVVFLGSEGETGVVARNLGAFLWLLADGLGPWEAATAYEPDQTPQPNPALTAVAEKFAPSFRAPAATVIEQAAGEFPDFDDTIMELCS
ncbi:SMI1/KNR4 family protein [Streptomyces brasiliscabiei]|uniref:SMI1/KNR4 family protein n=1 Tax=Streptomyces brasiliscabiei TaxID=2736302 RepID=A0ABU8GGC6_9ACTN